MVTPQWPFLLEALTPLLYVAMVALLVTILSHGQAVLVPVALAVMLTFILTPVVKALERRSLPRIVAVAVVIVLTLGVVGGSGYVLSRQFNDLAAQFPHYAATIKQKFATLRASRTGAIANIQRTIDKVSHELDSQEMETEKKDRPKADGKALEVQKNVQPVLMVPSEPTDVERFWGLVEPVFAPLARVGIVLVLTIFMLSQREDLRNRFIRVVGQGRVTLTTRTMDEAGQRISRFLLTQSVINAGFGLIVAVALFWIGVPYAILWGVTAALLRFVPYVGSLLAMLLPTALAFVLFDGWSRTLATLGLFLSLDAVTANVIEPLLIGHHTGVSSLALLVSALFWTWLWGPVGLVLSTPLTVCLAVLGKHVPRLELLAVLLGDEPALETDISFYQRLLAGDEDEASEIVEQQLQTTSQEQVFDEVLVPTLLLAERDRVREAISESEQQFVLRATRDIVQHMADAQARADKAASAANGTASPAGTPRGHIVGVPARTLGDQVALEMLSQLFDPFTCEIEQLSTATLASEVLMAVEKGSPDLICITALPPGGLTQARYLCKRLRTRFPEVRIVVVRPGVPVDTDKSSQRLTEAGANTVATSLTEARTQATQLLLPALVRSVEPDSIIGAVQPAGSPA
jgi:predicted PurR-regulated permease PerM